MKPLKKKIVYIATVIAFAVAFLNSCKKFIAIPSPSTQVTTASVFNNNATATSAVLNIYYQMGDGIGESYQIADYTGMLSDELTYYGTQVPFRDFYANAMNISDINGSSGDQSGCWANAYNYIYQANAIIAGLQQNSGISNPVKQQLTGEAYVVRAFWQFMLANTYGDVPVALTTDYTVTSKLSRTPQRLVYQQVISDLKTAEGLLNTNYVDATDTVKTTEKVRPNKSVADALLSKVYLYNADYPDAYTYASKVIGNTSLYSLDADPNNVFLMNSTEAIWQLQVTTPLNLNGATLDGQEFILTSDPSPYAGNNATISPQLLSAFENGDTRKAKWISAYIDGGNTYYFPFKYKYNANDANGNVYEYTMVLRLAEQYLIRAEAEANGATGGTTAAVNDLNVIRNRAGLPNYVFTTQSALLTEILHERQVEMFTEWGNRWFDLRRTGTINAVMGAVTPIKGGTWQGYQALFPIPLSEINADPNLTQNPGY